MSLKLVLNLIAKFDSNVVLIAIDVIDIADFDSDSIVV